MEFGKAQLLKYGWKEGKGLGRHETGIAEALKPTLKFDTAGIGHDGSEQFTYNWWECAFNKAAKNVKIHSTESGVVVQADEELDITTKKYSVLAMKKNKKLEYGTFLKTSTLTNEGRLVNLTKEEEVDEEEEEKSCLSENATGITDEELFKICGGRTAHKGARHGLTLNGKLARIEAQEQLLLEAHSEKVPQYEGQINTAVTNFSVGKKQKKKKKKKNKLKEQAELEIIVNDVDVGSPTHQATKKKKKRKVDEAITVECGEETLEVVNDISSKKKKRKSCNTEVQEDKCSELDFVESAVTGSSKAKKHKKRKKEPENVIMMRK